MEKNENSESKWLESIHLGEEGKTKELSDDLQKYRGVRFNLDFEQREDDFSDQEEENSERRRIKDSCMVHKSCLEAGKFIRGDASEPPDFEKVKRL